MKALADLRQARVDGRYLIIEGEINSQLVEHFQLQTEQAYQNIPEDDLIIELNTPGGDLACMNELFSEISVLGANDKLWIVGRGLVASAGLYLLGAVPREKRVALPYTKFFHHPAELSFHVSKSVKSKKQRK